MIRSQISCLHPALDISYGHREKWDGAGYPRRQEGEAVPCAARLFASVDLFDSFTSDRPYPKAREYIREQAGKHFGPDAVTALIELVC
ncbi:MAG: hypothetical protein JXA13_16635 [Anaerolineales bacterium]|nr:hypothetical protein [Anaerolineales bacterium]